MTLPAGIHRHPIAIIAFDRPQYLEIVLNSLKNQISANLSERVVALFQDSAVNSVSGEKRANEANINACTEIFRRLFPNGRIFLSGENLGVAQNFDRAEKFVFETLGADAAVFLEDDMVLSPHYINSLDHLIDLALHDERIGHVAVYGHHWVPLHEQELSPGRMVLLEHNWAFGLTKRQWEKNKPYIDQYLEVVKSMDYRNRDARVIHGLFKEWGLGCPGDSQDVAKTLACCLTRSVKLNTQGCLGKYIGATGLHMDPERVMSLRYDATEIFSSPILEFEPLTETDYQRIFGPQLNWAVEVPCNC